MKKIAFLTLAFVFCAFYSVAFAEDWKWVYSSDTTGYYIDPYSALDMNDYLTGDVKIIYEDPQYRRKMAKNFEKKMAGLIDLSNLYYIRYKADYKGENHKLYMRISFMEYCDQNDKVIFVEENVGKWSVVNSSVDAKIASAIAECIK